VKRFQYDPDRVEGSASVVNEYCSFWVNRDGSPTFLSRQTFDWVAGKDITKEERELVSSLYVSMFTEAFRRSVRGGVMHFVGLSYSTPGGDKATGATSDSLSQLNPPKFNPYFAEYVKDSFSLVAMTLDVWERECKPGETFDAPLLLHNDSGEKWSGEVTLLLYDGGKVIKKVSRKAEVEPYSKKNLETFSVVAPEKSGTYRLESELFYKDDSIRSRRRIFVNE
jgi:hypothetical protein